MEADEGSNGSDSVRGSQFRRRRSEPVHRRPRTLSQNNNFYGSGRASDAHMLHGEPRRPGAWEERKGGAGEFQNGDGRGLHRQTKLIGRDEDNAGRYDVRNGRYRQDNGYHEHRERGPEKRESGDGEVKSGSRIEAGPLLKKWNKVERNPTAAEAAVTHRNMNGVGDREHAANGRGAMVGSRPPGFARDRNEGDLRTDSGSRGNGDDAGGSHSKSPSSVRPGVTKLKLKVGGVTHTLHSTPPPAKPIERDPEPPSKRRRHRLILEQNSDDEDEEAGFAGVQPVQDATFDRNTNGSERTADREVSQHRAKLSEPAGSDSPVPSLRKSSRVPKKRILDGDEDDDHDSTRKGARKADNGRPEDEEDGAHDESTSDRGTENNTDEDDEDVLKTKKGRIQDIYDSTRKEKERSAAPLTARQRAMQEKDNDQVTSLIEFPDGLRDTQHRRKAKLSDADRQVKRAEAARKRKQQVEKNAKEIQASAIQKILGQDSSRKKREEKLSKQRAEIEEEKKAAALEPASNKIRWTVGPAGVTVSWSRDAELPVFFSSQRQSYPPRREKCAAPACENAYVYRDSKSKLPLCSLQCYRRVQGLTATAVHRPNSFDLVEAHLSALPAFCN